MIYRKYIKIIYSIRYLHFIIFYDTLFNSSGMFYTKTNLLNHFKFLNDGKILNN